jgi:hypothetical protein
VTQWQVRGELPGGRQVLFGLQADSRETAFAKAVELMRPHLPAETGSYPLEVTEIPSPLERIGLA